MKKGWAICNIDGRYVLERDEWADPAKTPTQVVREWRQTIRSKARFYENMASQLRKDARAKVHGMPKKKGKR